MYSIFQRKRFRMIVFVALKFGKKAWNQIYIRITTVFLLEIKCKINLDLKKLSGTDPFSSIFLTDYNLHTHIQSYFSTLRQSPIQATTPKASTCRLFRK